jgi:DNA-binding MarR family transcriptional regulator
VRSSLRGFCAGYRSSRRVGVQSSSPPQAYKLVRRLNACSRKLLTTIRNENPILIAFGAEGNSRMPRGSLDDLAAFVAIADHLSFRAAASRLGVTPSALSHSMRQLEERLGIRLLHRTTRSVSLTDAGLRFLARLRPAIDQIAGALEDLNQERERPLGRLRRSLRRFGDVSHPRARCRRTSCIPHRRRHSASGRF